MIRSLKTKTYAATQNDGERGVVMWEWIVTTLQKQAKPLQKMCCHMGTSADDIVSEACVELLEHKGLAERVYEKKEVSFLVSLLKRKLYEVDAKRRFNNKMDYSRYQKIMSICEEYHIEPIPENAYKIAAVTKNQHKNFGIMTIRTIPMTEKPEIVAYEYLEQMISDSETDDVSGEGAD